MIYVYLHTTLFRFLFQIHEIINHESTTIYLWFLRKPDEVVRRDL